MLLKKRWFSFLLVVALFCSMLPQMFFKAEAASTYTINGVNVHYTDFPSSSNQCWAYANNLYQKIWGVRFNNRFDDSSNMLRNLSDAELTLTEAHLRAYVSAAALGSCLRVCNEEYLHGSDGWGHSQLIVQKDSNGFTVLEGGLSSAPHCRERYYTWSEYAGAYWLGGAYAYIKYIKWPSAPAYSPRTPENLGNDFYALIGHPASGYGLSGVNYNVELGTANAAESYWRFIRQSDGSYKIYSTAKYGLLDVSNADTANGTNIQVCSGDTGSRAQNWYLYKEGNGYLLYSGLCDKVIDITAASTQKGANAQLYTYNGCSAQIFTITKECPHAYSSKVTQEPTCAKTGVKEYACTICGASYTKTIAATGNHRYLYAVTKEAGCTSTGIKTYACLGCSDSYTVSIPAKGHDYIKGVCSRCGNKPVGVKITKQPVSVKVVEGKVGRVPVVATGDGLTYTWYVRDIGDTKYYISSNKTNTYKMEMSDAKSGRRAYCVITDQYGNSVQTKTVILTMKKTVKIIKQPVSVTVAKGAQAKVTVNATGDGLTYRWYYKDAGESGYTYTSSFTGSSYYVTMNAARNGRSVLCRVYDEYGNVVQTKSVKLSMRQTVKITKQPVSATVAKGAVATVTVKATGDGLTYRWYIKEKGASNYTYTSSFKGNSYYVTMNAARNGRRVLCMVYDKYGNKVQSASAALNMK